MKSALMLLLLCSSALADEYATSPWISGSVKGPTIQRPQFMIISCGKGNVSISMDDGSVKFTDCNPDDGAKAFWEAIRSGYIGCPRGTETR